MLKQEEQPKEESFKKEVKKEKRTIYSYIEFTKNHDIGIHHVYQAIINKLIEEKVTPLGVPYLTKSDIKKIKNMLYADKLTSSQICTKLGVNGVFLSKLEQKEKELFIPVHVTNNGVKLYSKDIVKNIEEKYTQDLELYKTNDLTKRNYRKALQSDVYGIPDLVTLFGLKQHILENDMATWGILPLKTDTGVRYLKKEQLVELSKKYESKRRGK